MLLTVLGWVFTGLLLVLFGACVGAGRGGISTEQRFGDLP
jgi:hypothetical protein